MPRACRALFAAYWARGQDLSDPTVVARALDGAGFDGSELVRRAEEHKDDLRARTDEALTRGVFGAPAFFVDGELFWGQDRMEFVARALGAREDVLSFAPTSPSRAVSEVEIWYDFSSPFAYLGAMRINAVARQAQARVRWKPFLLGALFREIGTPDVPLHSFSQAKQRHVARDLERFAKRYDIPFAFPSHFPIRSVLPLRVALAAEDSIGEVSAALFSAAWAEDRDISDAATLRSLLCAAGHSPDLVDLAQQERVKLALRKNTSEAVERGLCGAPTFAVGEHLFWGQDRLELVRLALSGWQPRTG
jgi:2-hydroxychromene-2-carboxylate isomerase